MGIHESGIPSAHTNLLSLQAKFRLQTTVTQNAFIFFTALSETAFQYNMYIKAWFHDGEIVLAKYGWLHLSDSIEFHHFFRFRSE